jgi:hypothetical protein
VSKVSTDPQQVGGNDVTIPSNAGSNNSGHGNDVIIPSTAGSSNGGHGNDVTDVLVRHGVARDRRSSGSDQHRTGLVRARSSKRSEQAANATNWRESVSDVTYSSLTKEEQQRQHVLWEFVRTEQTFMQDLALILAKCDVASGIFSAAEHRTLFATWKPLLAASQRFLGMLHDQDQLVGTPGVICAIGDLCLAHFPTVKALLIDFIMASSRYTEMIQQKRAANSESRRRMAVGDVIISLHITCRCEDVSSPLLVLRCDLAPSTGGMAHSPPPRGRSDGRKSHQAVWLPPRTICVGRMVSSHAQHVWDGWFPHTHNT